MSGIVTELHLHPIKSCGRIRVEEAVVGPFGFEGDREWQVIIPDGRYVTQRTHPVLATVRPELLEGGGLRLTVNDLGDAALKPLEVAPPTGEPREAEVLLGKVAVLDAGDDAAAWFAALLGRPARLVRMAPEYERRLGSGPLDLWDQDVNLNDAAPVLVANRSSYDFLARDAAEPFPIERFRPNVVVDGFGAWEEDTWRTVQVGEIELHSPFPWPRCAMPQVDQDSGERHKEPAVVLKRWRWCDDASGWDEVLRPFFVGNAIFAVGFGARPVGGTVHVGDTVAVLETGEPTLELPTAAR